MFLNKRRQFQNSVTRHNPQKWLVIAFFILFVHLETVEGQVPAWVKHVEHDQSIFCTGLSAANDDGFFACGYFRGDITVAGSELENQGNTDVFWAKMDMGGNIEWIQSAGSSSDDFPTAWASDSTGNYYLAGEYWISIPLGDTTLSVVSGSNGSFIASFSPSGGLRWATSISGKGLEGIGGMDVGDDLIVSGFFSDSLYIGDTIIYSSAERGLFTAAFSHEGAFLWVAVPDVAGDWDPRSLVVGENDKYYIAGSFKGLGRFGGDTIQTNTADTDVFLMAGNGPQVVWGRKAGGVHEDELTSLSLSEGHLWLAGSFIGVLTLSDDLSISSSGFFLDGFLLEYDTSGLPLSAGQIGQQGNQGIEAAVIQNNLYITVYAEAAFTYAGAFFPYSSNFRQHYLLFPNKFQQEVDFIPITSTETAIFPAILRHDGRLFFGGGFSGEVDLDNEHFESAGAFDMLIGSIDLINNVNTPAPHSPGILLYPNPADNSFILQGVKDNAELHIYNAQGVHVYSGQSNMSVNCQRWPDGMYVVRVSTEKGYISLPLIVQH